MAVTYNETFTGSGALSSHTADSGQSYSGSGVTLSGGKGVFGASAGQFFDIGAVDGTFQIDYTPASGANFGLRFRYNGSADGYILYCSESGAFFQVYRESGGSVPVTSPHTVSQTPGTPIQIQVVLSGSSCAIYADGGLLFTGPFTVSANTDKTGGGYYVDSASGVLIDNASFDDGSPPGDTDPPTVTNVNSNTNGSAWTVTFSEDVTGVVVDDWAFKIDGVAVGTVTVSGSGSTRTFHLSRLAASSASVTFAYTGNTVVDLADNPLAAIDFGDIAAGNDSTLTQEQCDFPLDNYLFAHFTIECFTDSEVGSSDGTLDPSVFAPTDPDPGTVADACIAGGFDGVCPTADHQSGFAIAKALGGYCATTERDWVADLKTALDARLKSMPLYLTVNNKRYDLDNPSATDGERTDFMIGRIQDAYNAYGPFPFLFTDAWYWVYSSYATPYVWQNIRDAMTALDANLLLIENNHQAFPTGKDIEGLELPFIDSDPPVNQYPPSIAYQPIYAPGIVVPGENRWGYKSGLSSGDMRDAADLIAERIAFNAVYCSYMPSLAVDPRGQAEPLQLAVIAALRTQITPAVPTGISASAGNTSASVTLDPPNADYPTSEWVAWIEYRLDGGSPVRVARELTGPTDSFSITGLTNGQTYAIELRSIGADQVTASDWSSAEDVTPTAGSARKRSTATFAELAQ